MIVQQNKSLKTTKKKDVYISMPTTTRSLTFLGNKASTAARLLLPKPAGWSKLLYVVERHKNEHLEKGHSSHRTAAAGTVC